MKALTPLSGVDMNSRQALISLSDGASTNWSKLNIHSLLQHALERMMTVWYIRTDQKV
jgi:hypothetical protein